MKTDKLILDDPDKMEVVIQIPAKTQKLIHSIRPHKGHTLFEINPLIGECKEAVYESIDAKLNGGVSRKVIANDNCIYISSLNRKNALKRLGKIMMKQLNKTT